MRPISDVVRYIPQDALEQMRTQFSPSVYNRLLLAFRAERVTSFRVNTIKADKSDTMIRLRKDGFKLTQIPAVKSGFFLDKNQDNKLMKHELTVSGHIYLQSISSMLPAEILKPRSHANVLDIAAAPGSKTTQMAALMGNTGHIDAIEPDFIRTERLRHNCALLGTANVVIHQTTGQKFTSELYEVYDYILADVPCSGEGRFNIYDRASYLGWKKADISRLAVLQKKLATGALQALKPGGLLLYSTCTLNCEENESVIDALLQTHPNISIIPVPGEFYQGNNTIAPFTVYQGIRYSREVSKAMRVLPSECMEGFFICLIQKNK